MTLSSRLLFVVIFGAFMPALAEIDVSTTTRFDFPKQDMDKKYSYKDMCSILPANIQQEKNSNLALSKFADKGLQAWWNTPDVQAAAVAKTTTKAEKKLRADVTVRDEGEREHHFMVRVGAVQGLARLNYTGYANLEIRYEARLAQTAFEISNEIWQNKKLILGHYINPVESRTGVALRWPF
jgi:hypothetical protein